MGIVKTLAEFSYRDAAHKRPQSYCRDCSNVTWRAWYAQEANAARHRAGVQTRWARKLARNRALVAEAKCRPCADCGHRYPPYVMDFDHVEEKLGDISRLVYDVSTERLRAEIARCDVVCANCHRERTHRRAQARHRAHQGHFAIPSGERDVAQSG